MIDTHCHIDFPVFDKIRTEVIQQAAQIGVRRIVNIGADIQSSRRAVALASEHEIVYATVGVHPHDAKSFDDSSLHELRRLTSAPKVVGIGEIGLDYYRNLSPRDLQLTALEKQLQLALDLKLPVVIHTRESFSDTFDVVSAFAGKLVGGVFHCFSGTASEASRVIDLGFVVSVGGVLTYEKSSMADMAKSVPLEHILLETDAPYLTPVPHRGKTNQPSYVKFVCEKLASLHGVSFEEAERTTDANANRLFRLSNTFEG